MNALFNIGLRGSFFSWSLALLLVGSEGSLAQRATSLELSHGLKSAVNPFLTVEEFAAIDARQIRFTVLNTNGRPPGIDELEVFTDEPQPRNVALLSNGGRASISTGAPTSDRNQPSRIADGVFGQRNAWFGDKRTNVWVQVDLAQTERINGIVWSRDRTGQQWDRTAVDYRIEVATNGKEWTSVASSKDRLPGLYFGSQEVSMLSEIELGAASETLRGPVNVYRNRDEFLPVEARYVRFTVQSAEGNALCLDELEVYSKDSLGINLALAENGAIASSSNSLNSDSSSTYLNDGLFGDDSSWCSVDTVSGWVQISFPEIKMVDRVEWSRDRSGRPTSGTPIDYEIEVATELGRWRTVSSSVDRLKSNRLELYPDEKPPSEYLVDTWEEEDGIPLNSINDFEETPDGYLWIATDQGLLRFDGDRFKLFDGNNTAAITTPKVFDLHVDRSGRLWIVNRKFFYSSKNNLVVYENGVFRRVEVRSPHKVLDLFEERNGQLWMYTDQGALPWIDGRIDYDGFLRGFKQEDLVYEKLEEGSYERVLWDGVPGQWLHGEFKPFFGYRGRPLPISGSLGHSIQLSRHDGGGWILFDGRRTGNEFGLNRWCRLLPDGTLTDPALFPWTSAPFVLRWRFVDRSDNLWLSTPDLGLNCLLADGSRFLSFADTPGLSGQSVRRMFEDSGGGALAGDSSGRIEMFAQASH